MGMPACRISDSTAHGGIVTVGLPTVMIGFLPASRIGDLHTCPMVTGVVPHVGGPFILGSPTVLVGMMPQSRVTDQLTCVGPPDVAIKGEPTVLVGMAGAGGMVSASAGISVMAVPVPPAAPPSVSGGSPAAGADLRDPAPGAADTAAALQPDGTMKTLATGGMGLPPLPLQQEGWPDLPPEVTCTFRTVQPANVLPGTTLYAAADGDTPTGATAFWSADAPTATQGSAVQGDAWNTASHILVHTVAAGVKTWAGEGLGGGRLQLWAPADAWDAAATRRFRMAAA